MIRRIVPRSFAGVAPRRRYSTLEGRAVEAEEVVEEEEEDPDPYVRTHPQTLAARSRTHPSTVSLPSSTTKIAQEILAPTSQLSAVANKVFGGPGLPWSTATPASASNQPQKSMPLQASQSRMTPLEADAFLAAIMPGAYASVMNILVEVRQRLGHVWLRELMAREAGPRILDVGSGGAAVVAWREMLAAEGAVVQEEEKEKSSKNNSTNSTNSSENKNENSYENSYENSSNHSNISNIPLGTATVVAGSDTLTHRASRLLQDTTFLPRLPSAGSSKRYDLIVAPYTLWPLHDAYKRKLWVAGLWTLLEPDGGVLVLVEKGLPRGFEAIAGARDMLLQDYLLPSAKETADPAKETAADSGTKQGGGHIIAPCPTHGKCPMYPVAGIAHGRKDFCHFSQRFVRPAYLQHLLGASERNTSDTRFSYLAVQRGRSLTHVQDAHSTAEAFAGHADTALSTALSLPRTILPPLKHHGHVTLDVCTPAGVLERWIVPRSFSRQAYRDARKATWGDLWALGAKTRTVRPLRLGKGWGKGKGGR